MSLKMLLSFGHVCIGEGRPYVVIETAVRSSFYLSKEVGDDGVRHGVGPATDLWSDIKEKKQQQNI